MARRHKQRALDNCRLEREKADLAKEKDDLLARLRAAESMLAQQGPPHLSGSSAAGNSPQAQDLEPDGSAAGQG